ncbi:AEC family transporter [Oceanimonas doudoroffii]|uniref:Transporter n=1 Tax=Oceanimonas doudoroffii TaxID=84158 RepID=A0A233RGU2_9GAMM|nr:AEC family transporter [Oceanimonas doudoroffii]OXY82610.1 transporter [Oceanimonas doudoroffii]
MLAIISITAPIFLLIGMGYSAVRWRLIPADTIPGLGRFVLYFAMPGLILSTLSKMRIEEVIEPGFMLAYGLGSLLLMGLGLILFRLLRQDPVLASLKTMGMVMPNTPYFGFPVLLQVVDSVAGQALAMAMLVEAMLIIPLSMALLEFYSSRDDSQYLGKVLLTLPRRVLRNPMIIAILAGLLIALLELRLPQAIGTTLDMLGRASAAVALFVIGASLVGRPLKGKVGGMVPVMAGKLVVHPLLVGLMIWLLPPFNPDLQLALLLLAAMPMMSIYPIIGSQYGQRYFAAGTLLLTTLSAFASVSLLLLFVR